MVTASYTYLEKTGTELCSAPASTGVLLQFSLQAGVPDTVTVTPSTLTGANLTYDPPHTCNLSMTGPSSNSANTRIPRIADYSLQQTGSAPLAQR